jgi:hypothetical protein
VRDVMRADARERTQHERPAAPVRRPRPTAAEREAALELERLEAEASYHRDRLALYHAKVITARPSSPARLRELERASASADSRLAHARRVGSRL